MRTLVIAEIGINHNGDVEIAKQLIDAAALAGCDAVKFQKRTVELVYSKEMLDSPRESQWGKTQRDQKLGLEFEFAEYSTIDRYIRSHAKMLVWFASPWDTKSVYFLEQFDVPIYKVASPCLTNLALLKAIAKTKKPVIMSTGMSTINQIKQAVGVLETYGVNDLTLLACVSTYPCPVKDLNLNKIVSLKNLFPEHRVGYSGHEVGVYTTLCAAAMGAEVIERHITLDRAMPGSDQAASLEPGALIKLVKEIRALEDARGNGNLGPIPSELPIIKKLRS